MGRFSPDSSLALLHFDPAEQGLVDRRGELDDVLAAGIRFHRELLDDRFILRSCCREDIECAQYLCAVYGHVELSAARRAEVRLGEVQPHRVACSGCESWKRVREISHSRRLIHGHGRGVGHPAQVNGVRVVDRASAREVLIGHERCYRWPARIDLQDRRHTRLRRGAGLVRGRRRSPRIGRFHQIEISRVTGQTGVREGSARRPTRNLVAAGRCETGSRAAEDIIRNARGCRRCPSQVDGRARRSRGREIGRRLRRCCTHRQHHTGGMRQAATGARTGESVASAGSRTGGCNRKRGRTGAAHGRWIEARTRAGRQTACAEGHAPRESVLRRGGHRIGDTSTHCNGSRNGRSRNRKVRASRIGQRQRALEVVKPICAESGDQWRVGFGFGSSRSIECKCGRLRLRRSRKAKLPCTKRAATWRSAEGRQSHGTGEAIPGRESQVINYRTAGRHGLRSRRRDLQRVIGR